ncbi:MAG TPA: thiamine pyrophosphate-binding protein, partial [Gemmataceae bacterium]|nr:thiamine pyrophosphate-binding protein [Gemmataceae bacterium]
MARTVAEHLVDTLALAGVRQVYGVVGDSLNPVTDALRRDGKIKWVDVRHEETAAFAAGAEAQLTGSLAICAGSCGPGNLHLINGLYDAHRSMAPVLAIAAHIPSSEIGTGYFQETHPDQLFRECSHYCELISHPRQAPRVLDSAVQHAVSKRGVSVIVLPGDVAALDVPAGTTARGPVATAPLVRPTDADLGRLADFINGGKKVTLFCGIGCAGAHDEVVALAQKLQAPVGFSFRGKEWLEHDNPNAVGMTGLLGWGAAY